MIPSFKTYLIEEQKEVLFTFGRMNPPTIGHGKLMSVMATKAGSLPYKIFLSQSQDSQKNPLTYVKKVKHVRKMFPKYARNVIMNKKVKNVFDAATSLYNQGFNRITMIVGSDRVHEFEVLLSKYNGVKGTHGFYNFEKINVVSAGDRDPDAEGVEGMSASKQRENVKNNDFSTFSRGVPSTMPKKDVMGLFNDIRLGMGLKESKLRNNIILGPTSDLREKYIEGELFNEGDRVVVKSSQQAGYIHRLGTNYVIVALDEGRISRQWLNNLIREEMPQPEWGTSAATKKAKRFVPGQSKKSTEIDKAKQLVTLAKKRDEMKYDKLLDRARLLHARKLNAKKNNIINKK